MHEKAEVPRCRGGDCTTSGVFLEVVSGYEKAHRESRNRLTLKKLCAWFDRLLDMQHWRLPLREIVTSVFLNQNLVVSGLGGLEVIANSSGES